MNGAIPTISATDTPTDESEDTPARKGTRGPRGPRGRPRAGSATLKDAEIKMALKLAKLEGESEGRTLGRIEERREIIQWLLDQRGVCRSPYELARKIEHGDHKRR
jgi:hypothetical protein